MSTYPRMLRLRQKFPRQRVENIPATIRDVLAKLNLGTKIKPGQTVALTAGSRGIANIALILKSTVQYLRDLGAKLATLLQTGNTGIWAALHLFLIVRGLSLLSLLPGRARTAFQGA